MKNKMKSSLLLVALIFSGAFLGFAVKSEAKTQSECYDDFLNCFEGDCTSAYYSCVSESGSSSSTSSSSYTPSAVGTCTGGSVSQFPGTCKLSCDTGAGDVEYGSCNSSSGSQYIGYKCCVSKQTAASAPIGGASASSDGWTIFKVTDANGNIISYHCPPGVVNDQTDPRCTKTIVGYSGSNAGDEKCIAAHPRGLCVDTTTFSKNDSYECFQGLCPGNSTIQCCQAITGGSSNSALSNVYGAGSSAAGGACGAGFESVGGVCFPINTGLSDASISSILINLFSWLMGLFTLLAVMAFVISGIQYLASAGNSDLMETAKTNAIHAVIGIIVGLSGYIIIQAIALALSGSSRIF